MKAILQDVWAITRAAGEGFMSDRALTHSAAMAFYAATSLAPVLLIVIAIAGTVVGRDSAEIAISAELSGLLGPRGAELLRSIIQGAQNARSGTLASTLAIITILVSASGVFGEMQSSLNQIWKVPPSTTGISTLLRARAASLGLVAALGFLMLASLAASAAISGLGGLMNRYLPFGSVLLSITNTVVSVLLLALLFAAIYKLLPDRSLSWRDVRFGAVVTAILFTIGKALTGWYLGTSAVASSYGAAGSLIVLLLWVFYSSATFLFGAEITRAYTTSRAARRYRLLGLPPPDPSRVGRRQPLDDEAAAIVIAGISFVLAASATLLLASMKPARRDDRKRR